MFLLMKRKKTTQKIDDGNKDIGFNRKPHPFGIRQHRLGGLQKIVKGDDHHQGRILERGNQDAHRRGNHDFQRLGQNNQAHGLIIVESQ